MNLLKIEHRLDYLKIPESLLIIILIVSGFLVRAYFTYWDVNFESTDAFLFFLEAKSFSEGNFEGINIRSVWQFFKS